MTLGNAAAARVRLIVWCKDCRHQIEPDPAEMAQRYGAETTVLDWRPETLDARVGDGPAKYIAAPGRPCSARLNARPAMFLIGERSEHLRSTLPRFPECGLCDFDRAARDHSTYNM
jgi:hypothetical protein